MNLLASLSAWVNLIDGKNLPISSNKTFMLDFATKIPLPIDELLSISIVGNEKRSYKR